MVLVDKDSSGEPERLAWCPPGWPSGQGRGPGDARARRASCRSIPLDDGSYLQLVTVSLELPDGTKLRHRASRPT